MECSCLNSSFFSPYENGTKCESCLGSCPKSVEQLKTAIICLAVLAAAVLTSTIVISIMFCRSKRTGLPHLKQLKSHARAIANNSRAASQYAVELEAKQQHLAVLLQSVRQRRVEAHRLRGENTEFLSSGLSRFSSLNELFTMLNSRLCSDGRVRTRKSDSWAYRCRRSWNHGGDRILMQYFSTICCLIVLDRMTERHFWTFNRWSLSQRASPKSSKCNSVQPRTHSS